MAVCNVREYAAFPLGSSLCIGYLTDFASDMASGQTLCVTAVGCVQLVPLDRKHMKVLIDSILCCLHPSMHCICFCRRSWWMLELFLSAVYVRVTYIHSFLAPVDQLQRVRGIWEVGLRAA